MMLRIDLHIHSKYSDDGDGSPGDIIKFLKKKGLQGMAITDHNTLTGSLRAVKLRPKNFIVIPGVEISTLEGHIIALNIKEDIRRELTLEETVERIIELGGIPVVPHLHRNMSGIKKKNLEKIITKISTIEVFNSCSVPQSNLKSADIANEFKLGGTGGSDSHLPEFAGYGYTIVNTSDSNVDSILSEINSKKTWGEGHTLPVHYRNDRMIKSVKKFFQRGFKRV